MSPGRKNVMSEERFASASLTAGQLNAIVKKLGGHEAALRFLRDEIAVSEPARRWREEDGVIYFTLPPTDGTTGEGWIERIEGKRFRLSGYAKSVLRSADFVPTSGIVHKIAVLKGLLFSDRDRAVKNIRTEAECRKLEKPNAEVACLIRENFSDEEIEAMRLWCIVVMHDPINDSVGDPLLLGAHRGGGGRWLRAYYDEPDLRWGRGSGFAFALPQV